ncbi:hypothetical protein ABIA30_002106 [Mycobacterium sp. MAA66]|uniref:Rv0361 family membrane protein n=1 Tax=Mycobacterium sp. MAA66 TaxID=3156297 RepID=UPI00351796AA
MTEQEPIDRPTMAPFLGALAVIVVVIVVIVVLNNVGAVSGGGPTPEQSVRTAVVGQNDGLQRLDYGRFQSYTCKAQYGTQADVIAQQRDSAVRSGQRYIDEVSDIHIDGDHATAAVTVHFDKDADKKANAPVTLVREDGAWKVCSPVPSQV